MSISIALALLVLSIFELVAVGDAELSSYVDHIRVLALRYIIVVRSVSDITNVLISSSALLNFTPSKEGYMYIYIYIEKTACYIDSASDYLTSILSCLISQLSVSHSPETSRYHYEWF